MKTKQDWRTVPMFWLDGGRELRDDERTKHLAEYQRTGGLSGIVLCDPNGRDTPEEIEAICHEGPGVDDIDWTGFTAPPED